MTKKLIKVLLIKEKINIFFLKSIIYDKLKYKIQNIN